MSPTVITTNLNTSQRSWQNNMYQSNQPDPAAYGSYTTQPTGVSLHDLISNVMVCLCFVDAVKTVGSSDMSSEIFVGPDNMFEIARC
ncbi:hypothetical protein ACF0H5_018063 [Mactra antiquata]